MIECYNCGTVYHTFQGVLLHCSCGVSLRRGEGPTNYLGESLYKPVPKTFFRSDTRFVGKAHANICRSNKCGHFQSEKEVCLKVVEIGKAKGQNRAGRISWLYDHPEGNCPVGMWPDLKDIKVGFLSVAYMPIGGTETWHQTLVPAFPDAGFVSLSDKLSQGNVAEICPWTGVGLEAARILARHVDVLVTWGIGNQLAAVLPETNRPKVISVSHCDATSQWTCDMMAAQAPYTDQAVYICPTGLETIPEPLRRTAIMIPNGIQESRCIPTRSREDIRKELGVSPNQKLLINLSRISPEKRIHMLFDAVLRMPKEYVILVVGRIDTSKPYGNELNNLATDRIRLLPATDRVGDFLLAADAYVSASEYEGFGLSMAEAMYCKTPVISTEVGLLELDPFLAYTVKPNAGAAQFAEAILYDFKHPVLRQMRVEYAHNAVAERFSSARFIQSWKTLIDSMRPK